jgi:hypothetical protein
VQKKERKKNYLDARQRELVAAAVRCLLSKNIFCAKQGKMPLARIIRARTHDQKNDWFLS